MTKKEKSVQQLVYNSVTCTECKTTLVSYYRHDFKVCGCPNNTYVDGGVSYVRNGGKDLSKVIPLLVFTDDDFEVVRQYATRGARGKNGDEPLTWIPLCKMTDEHLENVIVFGGAPWHLELISKELQYRYKNGISISDPQP